MFQVANGVLSVALVEKVEGEASMFQASSGPLFDGVGMARNDSTPISRMKKSSVYRGYISPISRVK